MGDQGLKVRDEEASLPQQQREYYIPEYIGNMEILFEAFLTRNLFFLALNSHSQLQTGI